MRLSNRIQCLRSLLFWKKFLIPRRKRCQAFPQRGAFCMTLTSWCLALPSCSNSLNFWNILKLLMVYLVSIVKSYSRTQQVCLQQPEVQSHCAEPCHCRKETVLHITATPKVKSLSRRSLRLYFYLVQIHCKIQLRNWNKYWFPANGFSCSQHLGESDCLLAPLLSLPGTEIKETLGRCWRD